MASLQSINKDSYADILSSVDMSSLSSDPPDISLMNSFSRKRKVLALS